MGNRASPQSATRFTPFYLLRGLGIAIPPTARECVTEPVDFDDPEKAATEVGVRAANMQRAAAIAADNISPAPWHPVF